MDVAAHMLWTGAALAAATPRVAITRGTAFATIALAGMPDVLQHVPLAAWAAFGEGSWAALRGYALAHPGAEPSMPASVALVTHHLHCIAHSAVVSGIVTAILWVALRSLWIPLLGWWTHILIDVFTHSADFYPVPVLYPITYRGFDGIAWNEPWFMVLNYTALLAFGAWAVVRMRRRRSR